MSECDAFVVGHTCDDADMYLEGTDSATMTYKGGYDSGFAAVPPRPAAHFFFFFFTLVTGPRRSLSRKLSVTRVYEPQIRARLGTTAHFCRVRPTLPGRTHQPGAQRRARGWRRRLALLDQASVRLRPGG